MKKNYLLKVAALAWIFAIQSFAMDDERRQPTMFSLMKCSKVYAVGPDLENDEENHLVEYGNNSLHWCVVTEGANFGGYCKNNRCKAKGYVYMRVGKKDYLVRNGKYCEPSKCPECKEDVEIKDWGFSKCCFQIIAMKSSGTKIIRPWKRADKQYYNLTMDELGSANYQTVQVLYLDQSAKLPD